LIGALVYGLRRRRHGSWWHPTGHQPTAMPVGRNDL